MRSLVLIFIASFLVCALSQSIPAPGFANLKEGAALNDKQENALPDVSGTLLNFNAIFFLTSVGSKLNRI